MTARTQDAVVFGPKAKHAGLRAAEPKKCGARTSPTPGWAEGRLPKLPRTTAAAFVYCAGSSGAADSGMASDQVAMVRNIRTCLLYTSDAADDLLCVDLGGRR